LLSTDLTYIGFLSSRVRNFKKKSQYLWNFSCPFCGDSKKNPLKARGYVFRTGGGLTYKCHNCGVGSSFGNLLKRVDMSLYNDYIIDSFKLVKQKDDSVDLEMFKMESGLEIVTDSVLDDNFVPLSKLPSDHPAVLEFMRRKFPSKCMSMFYYTDTFKETINTLVPGKFSSMLPDHGRLILPWLDQHGMVFALLGRALDGEEPKYFLVRLVEKVEKVFGIDRVDYSKMIYVTEGPFDSLFLDNGVAVGSASLACHYTESIKSNCTLVFDNDNRNKQVCVEYQKALKRGFRVFIWPDGLDCKDINDLVIEGHSREDIHKMIEANSFNGLEGLARFTRWKKC